MPSGMQCIVVRGRFQVSGHESTRFKRFFYNSLNRRGRGMCVCQGNVFWEYQMHFDPMGVADMTVPQLVVSEAVMARLAVQNFF